MQCNFCGSPAAHPATGCVYGSSTIACAACVRECWAWVRSHVNKRGRGNKNKGAFAPSVTFYEAAAKYRKED